MSHAYSCSSNKLFFLEIIQKFLSGNDNGWGICENEPIWDIELLSGLKSELEEYGLVFEAIENFNPLHWHDILLDVAKEKRTNRGYKKTSSKIWVVRLEYP